ncbi:two-component system, response regulator YcbB [Dethiosulfatibacter aminovorans DSM 17477]|uniref:Two-component system, response regulator YcbB n=1 Tax=Dethiosulfatibacter aminovorans DSM 17477 TaxID=1121476 RepID=A0A1M6JCY1_9FIRM|nr:DNA-binding domain-containing protein [Dethiosulfatibacter aminovorans]SHJ44571.1 two-component system, response regulator YcbB [Dethiosulfatibacter aminovorans DSM 17477]
MRNQKIYLIDDDQAVLKSLKFLIEENDLGTVVGYTTKPLESIKDIEILKPQVVIVDYMMPCIDGPSLIEKLEKVLTDANFIMLSKVSDKGMIAEAYSKGIEYYINKPINIVEVSHILKNLYEKVQLQEKLKQIHQIFNMDNSQTDSAQEDYTENARAILRILGVSGKSGYSDIVKICTYVLKENIDIYDSDLKDIFKKTDLDYKSSVQRIRRCASHALRNIANLGLEDNLSEYFQKYSNSLFGFETVKYEMDHIRGLRSDGGKINVKNFLTNLVDLSKDY